MPWCATRACSFRVGLAVPMSRRRYTCRESAEITSTGHRPASASATAVLPTAVGPTSTGTRGAGVLACPLPSPKASLQLLAGQLHDRRAAVHVVRRELRGEQPEQ